MTHRELAEVLEVAKEHYAAVGLIAAGTIRGATDADFQYEPRSKSEAVAAVGDALDVLDVQVARLGVLADHHRGLGSGAVSEREIEVARSALRGAYETARRCTGLVPEHLQERVDRAEEPPALK